MSEGSASAEVRIRSTAAGAVQSPSLQLREILAGARDAHRHVRTTVDVDRQRASRIDGFQRFPRMQDAQEATQLRANAHALVLGKTCVSRLDTMQ